MFELTWFCVLCWTTTSPGLAALLVSWYLQLIDWLPALVSPS